MKKLALTFIAAVVLAVVAKGQDTAVYLPAIEPGQIWTEVRGYPSEGASSAIITMDSMVTVNDNLEYYVFRLDVLTINGLFYDRGYIPNYMRQSSDYSKVYLVDADYSDDEPYYTQERLVYDMSLNVGDTFEVGVGRMWDPVGYALVVDSVYTLAGRKHVRFEDTRITYGATHYLYFDDPLEFIEGIGPNWGWLWHDLDVGWPAVLLCVWRDGEQVNEGVDDILESYADYVMSGWDYDCTIINDLGEIANVNQANYKIFPNPVTTVLTIAGLPEKRSTVSVYDMVGNRLMAVECWGAEAEVDLSHLPSQLLLVSVVTDEGCSTYKVIKL